MAFCFPILCFFADAAAADSAEDPTHAINEHLQLILGPVAAIWVLFDNMLKAAKFVNEMRDSIVSKAHTWDTITYEPLGRCDSIDLCP
jgi:hypothetical protein